MRRSLTALRAAGRHALDPRYLRFLAKSGLTFETAGRLPSRHILEIFPEVMGRPVDMGEVTLTGWSMDPIELYLLLAIVEFRKPETIFEFGTYDGSTTMRLAHAAPEATIWTIDLGEAVAADYRERVANGSPPPDFSGIGCRLAGASASNVTQLIGDTRSFDFSSWEGAIDLVIVDADHAYGSVLSDSHAALRMVRSGGVVVWDDYSSHYPSVIRALDELAEQERLDSLVHVRATELAVYTAP